MRPQELWFGQLSPQKLAVALRYVRFPANREMLMSHARLSPVAESVWTAIESLPAREFRDLDEVCRFFGLAAPR